MAQSDEYDELEDGEEYSDEDIAALEDKPSEAELEETDVIVVAGDENLAPDTPVYRLRLSYSNETFLAAYHGEPLGNRSWVLVPTRYGRDLAQIIGPVQRGNSSSAEISRIERPADREDLEKSARNRQQEKDAFRICKERIEAHRLEMKLVSVHYLLEESKALFFFTAENRVDFRELVKDLVAFSKPGSSSGKSGSGTNPGWWAAWGSAAAPTAATRFRTSSNRSQLRWPRTRTFP
jgi:hypothetical protein